MKLRAILLAAVLSPMSIGAIQTEPTSKISLPEGPLKLRVVTVTGEVGIIKPGGEDIASAKAEMVLDEGVEVIVGQKSAIQLETGNGQLITFRRMTSAVITRAAIESGSINIDLGMKYGQASFEGEAQDRALRTSIHSPGATLAIRGTQVALTDQPPFAPEVVSLTGRVEYSDARKRVALGSKGGGKVRVNQKNETAAETALASSYVDPTISGARSPAEQRLVEQVLSTGAVAQFDHGFPIVRGGTPPSFQTLQSTLPLGLVYLFRWTGNVNFNLTVSVPEFGETIYPTAGANRGKLAFTPFDHQGGPKGGYETIVFPPGFPGSKPEECGKFDYFRRADYVPSGNASAYELRIYTNRTLNQTVSGEVLANGGVTPETRTTLVPFCPVPAPSAKKITVDEADCGCSASISTTSTKRAASSAKVSKRR